MLIYYWKCPECGFLWTIFEDQFRFFHLAKVVCHGCEKHELTEEEVRTFPSEEYVEWGEDG